MKSTTVQNPIKHRRSWLGLTQEQLAGMSGLSRQTITEVEAGLFRRPPETLLKALSSSQTDLDRLRLDYASWVAIKRRDNEYLFREDYTVPSFEAYALLIGGGSLRGFCRALMLQRSMVQTYLSSGANWDLIENCLWAVSLSGDFTRFLNNLPRSVENLKAA